MTYEELKAEKARKVAEARLLLSKCQAEGRARPNASELAQFTKLEAEIDVLASQIETASHGSAGVIAGGAYLADTGDEGPAQARATQIAALGARQIAAGAGRDYRSLFGANLAADGWKSSRDWLRATCSGRYDPALRAVSEGGPSEGGFLVPSEFTAEVHDVALEEEIVLPRARVEPMGSDTKKVNAVEIGSHASHLYGGVTAYWTGEAGALTETSPKFRQLELVAKKLTVMMLFSSEWGEDAPNGQQTLGRLAGGALGWYRDRVHLKGTGAGQPLGILNAPCLITVSKETAQLAATLQYENLAKMLARLHPACWKNSIWVIHPTLIPSLLTLGVTIGTGGIFYPTLREDSGQFSMLSRPVIFSEKMNVAGAKGDILLADFGQYVCGLRRELRFDTSLGPHFSTDQVDARLIYRGDGMPMWDSALTLADGTTTVGPFITLEARI